MRFNYPRREDYDSFEEWDEAIAIYEDHIIERAEAEREERKLRELED